MNPWDHDPRFRLAEARYLASLEGLFPDDNGGPEDCNCWSDGKPDPECPECKGRGVRLMGDNGMSQRAEAFPLWTFIEEELHARRWSVRQLAESMGGDADVNHCALDLLHFVPNRKMPIGERMASKLALAFGTSAELWMNLDKQWRGWCPLEAR